MHLTFKLAVGPDDLKTCQRALESWGHGNPYREEGHPTVMAFEGTTLRGFMQTAPVTVVNAVVCDRLAIDPHLTRTEQAFLTLRLSESYDGIMRGFGMRWYHCAVDASNKHLIQIISRALGCEPYATDEKVAWFKRELV